MITILYNSNTAYTNVASIADSLSQVLGTLRAEHGSAPTDHHRKNLGIVPELYRKKL